MDELLKVIQEVQETNPQLREKMLDEEIEEYWRTFQEHDKNGNGRIDANELGEILKDMEIMLEEHKIEVSATKFCERDPVKLCGL